MLLAVCYVACGLLCYVARGGLPNPPPVKQFEKLFYIPAIFLRANTASAIPILPSPLTSEMT